MWLKSIIIYQSNIVLKKAFLAFFNYGLHERRKRRPLKLLELKFCAIWRYFHVPLRRAFYQHSSNSGIKLAKTLALVANSVQ